MWDAPHPLIDRGSNVLSNRVEILGQSYKQINDILYMIKHLNYKRFSIFNLSLHEFTYTYEDISSFEESFGGCIENIDNCLIITGGCKYKK